MKLENKIVETILNNLTIKELVELRNKINEKITKKEQVISYNDRIYIKDYCDDLSLIKLLDKLNIRTMFDLVNNGYKNIPEYYYEQIDFLLKFFDFDKNKKGNKRKSKK